MNLQDLRQRAFLAATRHLVTLRPASFVRYGWWRLRGNRSDITICLRDGTRVRVRRGGEDFFIASEIFFDRQYDPPIPIPLQSLRVVIDVGANVGYSCLWFARRCPRCRILAFEPLAAHITQVQANLALNGLQERVELVAAAAASHAGSLMLEPAGARTAVVPAASPTAESVPSVDWFQSLPEGDIDLVKMDIEGGERELLRDPRFAELAARTSYIVVEWHDPSRVAEEKRCCRDRLAEVGFDVVEGADYGVAGLLWGSRSDALRS